jgi:prohibitin 1
MFVEIINDPNFGLVLLLGILIPLGLFVVSGFSDKTKLPVPRSVLLLLSLVFVVLSVLSSSVQVINYGTVGVITRFGQVTDRVLEPGLHLKFPIVENVLTYNTQKVIYETMNSSDFVNSKAEYKDGTVDTTTQDGQQIEVRYTIRFSIDPTKITSVANTLGTEFQVVEKVVKAESRVKVRNLVRGFTAEQLYTGDIDLAQQAILAELEPVFAENGIVLDFFGIRQIGFQEQYLEAIETKQIEKEKVQAEKFRAEQEEFRKQAAITKAEGEARAQQLQRSTLSSELLSKLWIEKWDGKLPSYLGSSAANMLLQIPNLK